MFPPQALSRVPVPSWWSKYSGVGSSLKGPWGNVLGVHTISLPLWPAARSAAKPEGECQPLPAAKRDAVAKEMDRVRIVKAQFDRKKSSYEAQFVRIQWDKRAVKAQVGIQVGHVITSYREMVIAWIP